MILPDVNVLIYAFRADLPQHPLCHRWLLGVISGDARFGLSPLVLSAVVRITTNPRAFKTPSDIEDAFGYLQGSVHGDGHPRRARERRLVCRARDRVGLRMGDARPRLRAVPGPCLAGARRALTI